MHIALRVIAADQHGEDRAVAVTLGRHQLLVVSDGAGGRAGGAAAAQAVVDAARSITTGSVPLDWAAWLADLDGRLDNVGEAAAVVALCTAGQVMGASVGDCGAWLISGMDCIELTAAQQRKPLMGSGCARAVAFGPQPLSGRLLLASDGLLKYLPPTRIQQLLRTLPIDALPNALIDAARLPSGALWDDIAVIVAG